MGANSDDDMVLMESYGNENHDDLEALVSGEIIKFVTARG